MKPYNDEGFFKASLLVIFLLIPLPFLINWVTWGDGFMKPYMSMFFDRGNCWENAKHEIVCKETVTCKFGRNFCE